MCRKISLGEEVEVHHFVNGWPSLRFRVKQTVDEVFGTRTDARRDVIVVLLDLGVGVLQGLSLKRGFAHQQCVPANKRKRN